MSKRRGKEIAITSDELAEMLKKFGFVTRKEVKNIVWEEIYKITKKHYQKISRHLQRLNRALTQKLLGKSKYFVSHEPYQNPSERELN